ncbi:peroxidase family protein [Actinomadura keratinilytica]
MRTVKMRRPFTATAAALLTGSVTVLSGPAGALAAPIEVQSLDGSGNNLKHADWGRAGSNYARLAPARYGDGLNSMWNGPNSRYVSNRLFSDQGRDPDGRLNSVNIFSENQVSQWGWVWGQFIDHTVGLALGREEGDPHGEQADIPLDPEDPLENMKFPATVPFTRSAPAPGTGVTSPRQQVNTASSYIDAFNVYGGTKQRLDWMREGTVDGDPSNNGARLLMPDGYLPRRDARGDASTAPAMELGGRLVSDPASAVVAGDMRANENILITAVQTLFAREHNRIVGLLPKSMPDEQKFQIARRVVIAEMQYITYNEFLPAMGVRLAPYTGYNPRINATLSTEFASVGFRVHSMIHGDVVLETDAARYSDADLDVFRDEGLMPTLSEDGKKITLTVVLNRAMHNPALMKRLQLGPMLQGIGGKPQYRNDELVEELVRNVVCSDPPTCVSDLAAIDLSRTRDHGIPSYNQLRKAYGLPPKKSFKAITGESSEDFPADPELTPGDEINDPDSIDFTRLTNLFGTDLDMRDEAALTDPVAFTRRTPLAARMKAIYGSVDKVEAYAGMLAEPHAPGEELGELEKAIWTKEFQRLRDGDRFFYGNQMHTLNAIKKSYGIDFRRNLGDIIADNTDLERSELPGNVFYVGGQVPPERCHVAYRVTGRQGSGSGTFTARVRITNTGRRPINEWALRFRYLNGQKVTGARGGTVAQNGTDVTVTGSAGTPIPPGRTRQVEVTATRDGGNPAPDKFTLNTTACSRSA